MRTINCGSHIGCNPTAKYLTVLFSAALATFTSCFLLDRMDVVTENDEYGDIQRTYTRGNLVAEKRSQTGAFQFELFLNVLRLDWRTGERYYYFVLRYNGRDWLRLDASKSLVAVADGRRIVLPGEGTGAENRSQLQDGTGAYFSEQTRFEVSPEQLRQISRARKVSIEVPTKSRPFVFTPPARAMRVFRQFVLRYLR